MIDWRKMKGFPKDRDVLVYDPDWSVLHNKGVVVAEFNTLLDKWSSNGGGWPEPTRWAYMPKPPNGAPQK